MNIKENYKLMEMVREGLGDENLVLSMAIEDDGLFFSISTHKSEKYQFDHGGLQRTCTFLQTEYEKNIDEMAKELVKIYSDLLIEKTEKSTEETEENNVT